MKLFSALHDFNVSKCRSVSLSEKTVRHLMWFYLEVTDSQSEFVYQTRSRVYLFSQSGKDMYLQLHDIVIWAWKLKLERSKGSR